MRTYCHSVSSAHTNIIPQNAVLCVAVKLARSENSRAMDTHSTAHS